MSDDSLFSKHMRLIEKDESAWTETDRQEFNRIKDLKLPPLELKPTWWQTWRTQIQVGAGALAMASFALIFVLPKSEDGFNAKGSMKVSVIWEREGKVSPLKDDSELKDGDKIGASVISSEEAVAFWAITDDKMKILNETDDIEASRIQLEPGVSKSFGSSFVLTSPNQGENLLVAVCPKSKESGEKKAAGELFDRELVGKLLKEPRVNSSDCTFIGFRLRRLP